MWLKSFLTGNETVSAPLYLYNTLGRAKQLFALPKKVDSAFGGRTVRMYNCGPTVYDVQHIGNLSMFVFTDVLRRVLLYNEFKVKQVINITDVGHLTSDADYGDDKMAKGLKREGKKLTLDNMKELGEKYAKIFLRDIGLLNIDAKEIDFPREINFFCIYVQQADIAQKDFSVLLPELFHVIKRQLFAFPF